MKNNQNENEEKIEKDTPKTREETVIVSQGNESSIFQENLVVCLCVDRRSWILNFEILLFIVEFHTCA